VSTTDSTTHPASSAAWTAEHREHHTHNDLEIEPHGWISMLSLPNRARSAIGVSPGSPLTLAEPVSRHVRSAKSLSSVRAATRSDVAARWVVNPTVLALVVVHVEGGLTGREKGVSRMVEELRLHFAEDGADPERVAVLTGYLRDELRQLDVDDVSALSAGVPPPGSRAFDAVAVGGLLVTLGRSADGLRSVVGAVRKWLARGDGVRRTVRLELGGDVLELSEASAAEQQRLIDLFVRRHGTEDGTP
jgi:hypothetical protein